MPPNQPRPFAWRGIESRANSPRVGWQIVELPKHLTASQLQGRVWEWEGWSGVRGKILKACEYQVQVQRKLILYPFYMVLNKGYIQLRLWRVSGSRARTLQHFNVCVKSCEFHLLMVFNLNLLDIKILSSQKLSIYFNFFPPTKI